MLLCLVCFALLTSCSSVQFYTQAVLGQSSLLLKRRDITSVINDEGVDVQVRQKLSTVLAILAFAEQKGLPTEGAYETFVSTGKPFVVWNVYAAPEFSLQMKAFCYPIAGCVNYRGYFSEEDALRFAESDELEGLDVFVGGITAYSTLGWFSDPVLDTFLNRSDTQLALLLFHELAHRVVYVQGDTRFNESFATAVAQILLKQWLAEQGKLEEFQAYLAQQQRRQEVFDLIEKARGSLVDLYDQKLTDQALRSGKSAVFAELRKQYKQLKNSWDGFDDFSYWMSTDINNARIGTLDDYNGLVPAFVELHANYDDMTRYFKEVERIGRLSQAERDSLLEVSFEPTLK